MTKIRAEWMNGEDAQDVQSDPGRMGDGYGTDGGWVNGESYLGENGENQMVSNASPKGIS